MKNEAILPVSIIVIGVVLLLHLTASNLSGQVASGTIVGNVEGFAAKGACRPQN